MLEPPPLTLVDNGRLIRAHMRRELLTMEELQTALREQGIETLADVKLAAHALLVGAPDAASDTAYSAVRCRTAHRTPNSP